jgi:hypothetical protein
MNSNNFFSCEQSVHFERLLCFYPVGIATEVLPLRFCRFPAHRIYPRIPPVMGWAMIPFSCPEQTYSQGQTVLLYRGIKDRAVTIAFV